MKIHIDPNSLDRTDFGLVTGIIFFQDNDYYFPDRNWNDSIFLILDSLFINISQQRAYFEVLYMEVSCEVHIHIDYSENTTFFSFLERGKAIEYESQIKLSSFIKNLNTETNRLIRESEILSKEERKKYTDYISYLSQIMKMYE